jgi:putative hydrolase of the HAD superfamily
MKNTTSLVQPCSIALVLFDFGGVLAEEGFKAGLTAIAQQNNIDTALFIKKAYELTFAGGFCTARIDEKTFWHMLREQTGIQGSDAVLRHEVLSRFTLRPWMKARIKKLKEADIRVAILSDQTKWLDELNDRYDFFNWFDRVFNSYYLGKSKQDPAIFCEVLKEMKVSPVRTLFIDDSTDNIARAVSQGLHTILYQDRETFEKELACFCPFLQ